MLVTPTEARVLHFVGASRSKHCLCPLILYRSQTWMMSADCAAGAVGCLRDVVLPKKANYPTCLVCGKRLGRKQQKFCSSEHRYKWNYEKSKNRSATEKRRAYERRTAPRGRQCKHCQAFDDETRFLLSDRCASCDRVYQRNGLCDLCGRIRYSKFGEVGCPHCFPLLHVIPIVLIERKGPKCRHRERTIFRFLHDGKVRINKVFRTVRTLPCVMIVSTPEWVSTRR